MQKINPQRWQLDFSFEDALELDKRGLMLVKKAKGGWLQAIRDLGCAYIHAENGFPKDEVRARKWYKIAADHGQTQAMWDLAMMNFDGEGGEINHACLLEYMTQLAKRKRCDLNVVQAAEVLVDIYEGFFKLNNVAPDAELAEYWKQQVKIQRKRFRGWKRTSHRWDRSLDSDDGCGSYYCY